MLFTFIGIITGIVMAVLITYFGHVHSDIGAILIGFACGLACTTFGIWVDSNRRW
jgi:hypothetical protein